MEDTELRLKGHLELFHRCMDVKNVEDKKRKWMAKWFEGYIRFHRFHTKDSCLKIPVTLELLVPFLKQLRDRKIPAWQRLQAAKSAEAYEILVLRTQVDFSPITKKLQELADKERLAEGGFTNSSLVPGEGNSGLIDPEEPKPVIEMRKKLRLLHYPKSTETAYVRWLKRFMCGEAK